MEGGEKKFGTGQKQSRGETAAGKVRRNRNREGGKKGGIRAVKGGKESTTNKDQKRAVQFDDRDEWHKEKAQRKGRVS